MKLRAILFALVLAASVTGCGRASGPSDASEEWVRTASRESDKSNTVVFGDGMPADAGLRSALESALDHVYYGPVFSGNEQSFSTRVFEVQSVTTPSVETTDATLIVSGVLHETQWSRFGPFPDGSTDHRPTSVSFSGESGTYRYLRGFQLQKYIRNDYSKAVERVDVAMALAFTEKWRQDSVWGPVVFSGHDAHHHSPTLSGLRELSAKHLEGLLKRREIRWEYVVESSSPDGRYQIRRKADPGMEAWPGWWLTDTQTGKSVCLAQGQDYPYIGSVDVKPVWYESNLAFDIPLSDGPSESFVHCVMDLKRLRIVHAIPVGLLSGQDGQ